MAVSIDLHLPRNAFTPRDAARAGDVWRGFQDVAVLGASALGWPPQRFRSTGAAFVVRHMTVRHHSEARYGERLRGQTWISDFRRGLLCRRQIRLEVAGRSLADATQQWAHVSTANGRMKAVRAAAEIVKDFPVEAPNTDVEMPAYDAVDDAPAHRFSLHCWHTWMDPLAHANHPAYVDWSEEALARIVAGAGLDPVAVQPVAESARWRVGAQAPDDVLVTTRLVGVTSSGDAVCEHSIEASATGAAATVHTVRRLVDGNTSALVQALLEG